MRYEEGLCVPNVNTLINWILEKGYGSRYSIHQGSTKIYHDLRRTILLDDLKMDIAEFVARYPNCRKVKVEH